MNIKKFFKEIFTIRLDRVFGLDLGDRSIEIVELDKAFRFSLITHGRAELPEGVMDNGRILNQAVLAESLKKLLREMKPKKVSTNKVVLSLPASQTLVKCFVLDGKLKGKQLNLAVYDQMVAVSPINPDKMYWDFVERPLTDPKKKLIVYISVPKDIVSGYVRFCNSIGLEVVALSVEALSLARVILKKGEQQSLIMDIGAHSTNLGFYDSNDKINMSITIPVAGNDFTKAVQTDLNLEFKEAEALKIKNGFKDVQDNKVRGAILPVLQDILSETAEAVKYYEETFKQKLDAVYISGGSALLPGMAGEIKKVLGREVQMVSAGLNLNVKSLGEKQQTFPLFANVLGLGMLGAAGEYRELNLLKKMPAAEINVINKLNLFNLGYLSRVNTVRTILNNKYVLIMLVILIGVVFAVLLQQAENYGLATAAEPVINLGF